MPKGQQRGNREKKKPKADKTKAPEPVSTFAQVMPGGKKKPGKK